jgi:hypothetical protein
MAQRTMTVCDIDDRRGDTVVATAAVRLDLAGEVHQLDVCAAHLDELRAALTAVLPQPPVSRRGGRSRTTATGRPQSRQPAGRSSRGRRTTTSRSATLAAASPDSGDSAEADGNGSQPGLSNLAFSNDVRQWARDNGIEVKDQGRMSKNVVEQYRDAHD